MDSKELKRKYLEFFKKRGHTIIPSAPLIPENDPSVLFTTAGMHPLVPYLLGEVHPGGKRLADVQLCLRTDDIDEVGDTSHHTFFEMLGNWSLGDYWKKESLAWSFEFLTRVLGLEKDKISVTCFAGDKDAPKDEESATIWRELGIPEERIYFLPKKDNWWGPVGEKGPCGPDSEIFIDTTGHSHGPECRPGDGCGRYFEVWNNVFMQYNKTADGKFAPLPQKNVDTGMGVDRTTAVVNGLDDDYLVPDLWGEIIGSIEKVSNKSYEDDKKSFRIIADHVRALVFVIAEGILPANKERGYVLRRLVRRAIRAGRELGIDKMPLAKIAAAVVSSYGEDYPHIKKQFKDIETILVGETDRFITILDNAKHSIPRLAKVDKITQESLKEVANKNLKTFDKSFDDVARAIHAERSLISTASIAAGTVAYTGIASTGIPPEVSAPLIKESWGIKLDDGVVGKTIEWEKNLDRNLSRTASAGMFKGGLSEQNETTAKLHTATHLLHAALRKVLGEHVSQKGSNITSERLRFDFSHTQKLTDEELTEVQNLVNQKIEEDLPVSFEQMGLDEAVRTGALHFFGQKYGDEVKVYSIGDFSKEVCGGPHVTHTGRLGHVRIIKQERLGSGIIRIYASTE